MGTKNINIKILMSCFCVYLVFILTGCPPFTSPDLVPKQLFFDHDNVLNIMFANEGNGKVPANKGNIAVFIDGRPVGGYSFSNLADQSFRSPGGSLTIGTNFRLAGRSRRIAVFLDSENEIKESNEFQNTLTRALTPPAINGPDLIIYDLAVGPGSALYFVVKNIGTGQSPEAFDVNIEIIVNKTIVSKQTVTLPSLNARGGTKTIKTNPPVLIRSGSKVRVSLNTLGPLWEIDNTNNMREEILPGGPSLAPYTVLLSRQKIANAIIWENKLGSRKYPQWTNGEKNDLNNAILALERGEPQELSEPPALIDIDNYYISAGDAWKIYIAHVVQCLWVEVNGKVSWHLEDFSHDQLAYLLDVRKLMRFYSTPNRYEFDLYLMGNVTAWNPQICYRFLSNLNMIKSSQIDSVYAFTDWMRGHLIHISDDADYIEQFGYAGYVPMDKVLFPLEGKRHITAGCWGTTGLYASVLRSVNIPVISETIKLDNDDDGEHSRPVFTSIN